MSEKITLNQFNLFKKHFVETCLEKMEEKGSFIECFEIAKEDVVAILTKAEESDIPCRGIRIYFGKKEVASEEDIQREKFYTESNYNLLVLGVDDKGQLITKTGEIYDNLTSCPPDC